MKWFIILLAVLFVAPARAQNVLFPANQGDMIVKGATTWGPVPGGTAGCVLRSNGPTAAPTWQCSLPLNFQLPPMAVNTVWCNVSGAQAPATACSISQILSTIDYDIQRPPLAGSIPYVGANSVWHLSPPPAAVGWVWTAQGVGQAPQWVAPGGYVPPGAAGTCLVSNGPTVAPSFETCPTPGSYVQSFNTRTGAVTPASGDYSVGQVMGAAPIASPTFTGVPAGPTAAPGTNTTQFATTAYVLAGFAPLALQNGRIFVGNASNVATGVVGSGDCTIVAAGALTCTKTSGVTISTLDFPTRVAAIAATVPASGIDTIILNGYAAAGDTGQGARYKRTASACNVAWRFASADGQCWQLSNIPPVAVGFFGGVGGSDDAGATINNSFAYLDTFGGGCAQLAPQVYRIVTTVEITKRGLCLKGQGWAFNTHYAYPPPTILNFDGTNGNTLMYVHSINGSDPAIDSITVSDIAFYANGKAGYGLLLDTVFQPVIERVFFDNFLSAALTMGGTFTAGGQISVIAPSVRDIMISQPDQSGAGILFSTGTVGNTNFGNFENIWIVHKNGNAITVENADNLPFWGLSIFRIASGTGRGILLKCSQGGAWDTGAASNFFARVAWGDGGVYAEGTGDPGCVTPSVANVFMFEDKANTLVAPIIGTNATLYRFDYGQFFSLFLPVGTPASAAAACTKGIVQADTGFIYVCTATNTWKRVAIATW